MILRSHERMLSHFQRYLCPRFSVVYRARSSFKYVTFSMLKTMPFEKNHQKQARHAYECRKEKYENLEKQSKFVNIEVLGNGAHGCPRSVHLIVDSRRYLFNCGEGTQRLANELKTRLSRNPHVFITYPSWQNVSGLLGMALTLQGIGIPELFIHGPKVVENVFYATNKFVALRTITLHVKDTISEADFDDGFVNIKSIPLYSSINNSVDKKLSDSTLTSSNSTIAKIKELLKENEDVQDDDDIDYYDHLNKCQGYSPPPAKRTKKRSQSLASRRNVESIKHVMCFICRTKKSFGTLLIEKCVDLGVPYGPLLGQLKKGETITLPNGNVVKGSDVKKPDIPGAVILVVECPSEDYLDSLLKESAFYRFQSGNAQNEVASAVIHFTNSKVLEHPKYKEWINRFPLHTKHLIIGDSNKGFGSLGVHRLQYKLNMLHPEIFPLLPCTNIPSFPRIKDNDIPSGHVEINESDIPSALRQKHNVNVSKTEHENEDNMYVNKIFLKCSENSLINGEMMCKIMVKPISNYDYSKSIVLKPDEFRNEVLSNEKLMKIINKFNEKLNDMKFSDQEYPKILFLGTGSSQPNKLRNTSGILLFLDEKTHMILDCGEGTYSQLYNFYGRAKAHEILLNLDVIYVSHLHADHHMGLITLLKERALAHEEKCALEKSRGNAVPDSLRPISLLAPIQITKWLHLFDADFDKISHLYNVIPNANLADNVFTKDKYFECLKLLNLKEIKTTLVDHCPNAFGIAITHNDGWKITYSGDTRPCKELIRIGANSDILIHEATMDDSLLKSADMKLHSTSGQAINVGKEMKAKFTILTHFSQRYSHIPLFNSNFTDNVGVAFDNMMVCFNQLPILSKLRPALKLMFSDQYELMEEKNKIKEIRNVRRKQNLLKGK